MEQVEKAWEIKKTLTTDPKKKRSASRSLAKDRKRGSVKNEVVEKMDAEVGKKKGSAKENAKQNPFGQQGGGKETA